MSAFGGKADIPRAGESIVSKPDHRAYRLEAKANGRAFMPYITAERRLRKDPVSMALSEVLGPSRGGNVTSWHRN